MKNLSLKYLLVSALVTAFFLITGCGGSDPSPTAASLAKEEITRTLTSGAWKMQTVAVDGVDQTTVYKNLVIVFSNAGFTATNGGFVWPASGTWKFTDDTAKTIERNDGLTITIDEATATKLVVKLTWTKTTIGPGRTASVSGLNVFTFGH